MGVIAALPTADHRDHRVVITPGSASQFHALGWRTRVLQGAGIASGYSDEEFELVGTEIAQNTDSLLESARVGLCMATPVIEFIQSMPESVVLAGFLDPFQKPDTVDAIARRGLDALSLELVPRTTIAQPMDALSSQASLAGYAATILAASRLTKALPMMSTPAGTIKPAKVLVVGTGVAGLQAIATSVRLGARVTAYDVRPTAKEQVESLGARFAKIDIGETGEAAGGYAKQLTEEQLDRQRQQLARLCAESDIIITTAQIFGKAAPKIITREMISGMRLGSVIVDAATPTGGNVDVETQDHESVHSGVTLIKDPFLISRVARDASDMLASNFVSLIRHVFDNQSGELKSPESDDIIKATLLTSGGQIRDERVVSVLSQRKA